MLEDLKVKECKVDQWKGEESRREWRELLSFNLFASGVKAEILYAITIIPGFEIL